MTRKLIVGDMIRYYLQQNKMTIKELGLKLGKGESTVSKWINNKNMPMAKDLSTMTCIFKTDIQTLMYGGNVENDLIAKTEKTMQSLSSDRQQNVYNYAEDQLKEQTDDDKVVELPQSRIKLLGAVSAGTGEELVDDSIDVDYTGWLPDYDYALLVNGDSMEPLFSDQQIIFVKHTDEAFNGQIVIAYVDGKAYVKKYHRTEYSCELISLNDEYSPIKVTKDTEFRIKGVVIL